MELLVKLNEDRNISIAMVTHEPDMERFVGRVILFRDGKVVDHGVARRSSLPPHHEQPGEGA